MQPLEVVEVACVKRVRTVTRAILVGISAMIPFVLLYFISTA